MNTVIDGVDYGPLALLIGTWKGEKGMDVAPESDGSVEENPYYEEIVFEAAGDVDNADTQELAIVRYHQKVFRKSNDEQFHDQVGYWLWDAKAGQVINTFTIPRAVGVVAIGDFDIANLKDNSALLKIATDENSAVAESPFMQQNASTKAFKMNIKVDGDKMSYSQTSYLDIYGRDFDHTDRSSLQRVA